MSQKLTMYNGKNLDIVEIDKEYLVVAKEVKVNDTARFYIKLYNNFPVDPNIVSKMELKSNGGTFVNVKEEIYNKYVAIISGKSNVSVRSIERLM